ncbi:hypothetical protein KSC_069850 [Ktedonobacter sp. SOSP1-52]|nr:hypothetical protein KSC_069850 [Ktedonobacter sp. SOSP1-52]
MSIALFPFLIRQISPQLKRLFQSSKRFSGGVGAHAQEALRLALAEALEAITAQDTHGWFTHCGYLLMDAEPVLSEEQLFMPQAF